METSHERVGFPSETNGRAGRSFSNLSENHAVPQILHGPQKSSGTSPVRQFFGFAQQICLDSMENGIGAICEQENTAQMLVDFDRAFLARRLLLIERCPSPSVNKEDSLCLI